MTVARRTGAVLATSSAVLHGLSLGHAGSGLVAGVTVAMMAACLYCAGDLWVHGTLRAWVVVALMNLGMIAVHAPMTSAHHHGGGVIVASAPAHHSTVMTLATAFAAAEVMLATAVVYYRTRHLRLQWARGREQLGRF